MNMGSVYARVKVELNFSGQNFVPKFPILKTQYWNFKMLDTGKTKKKSKITLSFMTRI
jgi:hypothetical protein